MGCFVIGLLLLAVGWYNRCNYESIREDVFFSGQEVRVCCWIGSSRSVSIVRSVRLCIRDIRCRMIRRSRCVRLVRSLLSVVVLGSGSE